MAVTFATVASVGSGPGPRLKYEFYPETTNNTVTIADEDYIHVGPFSAVTDAQGGFELDLPLHTDQGDDALVWRVLEVPQTQIPGRGLAARNIGYFTITGDIDYDDLVASVIEATAITPDLAASVAANAAAVLGVIATSAGVMATVDADDASTFRTQQDARLAGTLAAETLIQGHSDVVGSQAAPLFEIGNESDEATFHLLAGVGFTGPYLLGLGVDHDGATGQTISVKADDNTGLGINLETTSGVDSVGLLGANFGPGNLVELRKGGNAEATGPLVSLRNDFGGDGDLLEWGTTAGELKGYIDSTGALVVQNHDGLAHPHLVRFAPSSGGGPHGSGVLYWTNSIDAFSNHFLIRQSNGAAALGAEVENTMIEFVGGNQIGFFGAAPVVKQTLPAAATDAATTQTLANALRTLLINYGLA
jgi:hypothetical protein